jgi:hypothetical protein
MYFDTISARIYDECGGWDVKWVHPDDLIAMLVLSYRLYGMWSLPQLLMGSAALHSSYHYLSLRGRTPPEEEGEIREPQVLGLGVKLDHDKPKQYNAWCA